MLYRQWFSVSVNFRCLGRRRWFRRGLLRRARTLFGGVGRNKSPVVQQDLQPLIRGNATRDLVCKCLKLQRAGHPNEASFFDTGFDDSFLRHRSMAQIWKYCGLLFSLFPIFSTRSKPDIGISICTGLHLQISGDAANDDCLCHFRSFLPDRLEYLYKKAPAHGFPMKGQNRTVGTLNTNLTACAMWNSSLSLPRNILSDAHRKSITRVLYHYILCLSRVVCAIYRHSFSVFIFGFVCSDTLQVYEPWLKGYCHGS